MLLSHDDVGAGPPVVLLHAGVCDRRMWAPLVPALAHSFRVVTPDLRGFGESPLPGEPFSHAADVVALLDDLGLASVALVGSSLGGQVALEVASRLPGRVSELVLLCAASNAVERTASLTEFGAEEGRLIDAGDLEGAVALNVRTWLGPDASPQVRELVAAMQRRAFEVQLAADAGPEPPVEEHWQADPGAVVARAQVVSGGHDLDFFQRAAEHLAREIPGAELVRLPWAGHLPSLERPDAVLALLLDVLRPDADAHAP